MTIRATKLGVGTRSWRASVSWNKYRTNPEHSLKWPCDQCLSTRMENPLPEFSLKVSTFSFRGGSLECLQSSTRDLTKTIRKSNFIPVYVRQVVKLKKISFLRIFVGFSFNYIHQVIRLIFNNDYWWMK